MPGWRPRDEQDREWAIPMGGQVTLEAERRRKTSILEWASRELACIELFGCGTQQLLSGLRAQREAHREAELRKHGADAVGEAEVKRRGLYLRGEDPAVNDFPHPSRVTPTGPGHVTGVQPAPTARVRDGGICVYGAACCGDPGDCTHPCP